MKIRPVGAELSNPDGQTDMKKIIVAFRNFVNAPKKWQRRHAVYTNSKKNVWVCSKFVWGDKTHTRTHTNNDGHTRTDGRTDTLSQAFLSNYELFCHFFSVGRVS